MKEKVLSPVVTGIVIAIAVIVVIMIGWKSLAPRNDGPTEPLDMGKAMGAKSSAPSTGGGGAAKPSGGTGSPVRMGGG